MFRRFVDEGTGSGKSDSISPQKLPILVKSGKSLSEEARERLPKTANFCFSIATFSAEDANDLDADYAECFTILERVCFSH